MVVLAVVVKAAVAVAVFVRARVRLRSRVRGGCGGEVAVWCGLMRWIVNVSFSGWE